MKIIDAHSHIGNFGSWARFDFDLARLKEQMGKFDIEKTLLSGAGAGDYASVLDAFQKEPDLVVPIAWVKPGGPEALDEMRRVPVFIHSGHPPYSLPWQIGWLAERHPRVPVVLLHMGHAHGVYVDAALKTARRYPNVYLETSGTSMSVKIREAYETVGADCVLFGIDSPFHEPSVEIEKTRSTFLPDDALRRIYHDNTAKLLGL